MMVSRSISRPAALAILGLSGYASVREVTAAYRRLAKTTHPDVADPSDHDAGERFAALTEAYDALTSNSTPPTSAPTGSPSPARPPSGADWMPRRGPVLLRVRFTRSPIIAGPVSITAPPSTSRKSP